MADPLAFSVADALAPFGDDLSAEDRARVETVTEFATLARRDAGMVLAQLVYAGGSCDASRATSPISPRNSG